MQGTTQAVDTDLVHRRQVVDAFLAAARGGDFNGLLAVLDPDVVLNDAAAMRMGAAARHAAQLRNSRRAARTRPAGRSSVACPALRGLRRRIRVITFDVTAGRIVEIDFIGKGEHLDDLDVVLLDS